MSDLQIRDVRTIITHPPGARTLTVVKVETDEPELYGLGCASFCTRPTAVAAAVDDYLKPFLVGKDPGEIEDIWQSCHMSSYWRNGPVLNNALSGVDQALWDIKGKAAGMPLYELFGGKSREAAAVYVIPQGRDRVEYEEHTRALLQQGFHHIKIGWASAMAEGERPYYQRTVITPKASIDKGSIIEATSICRNIVQAFEQFRSAHGPNPEVLFDVKSPMPPIQGLALAKDVEPFKPYFLEDLFAPEDNDYFRLVREQTSTPMAMGELYSNPREVIPVIKDRLIDFLRLHISTIGGLTPARKLAALCEAFNVRTAWHGSADVSPVGHAANLMLDMNVWNFGVQEASCYLNTNEILKEVFPGVPEVRGGYMWPNGKPGLGVDINEQLAARYPLTDTRLRAESARRPDGTVTRP
ncbi:MAG: starvation-sensing protein RspA [Candidatus Latescibacteria bacterium]|nr:starvation-sensing protein RspA [Candidatus Latescibacterota bacterium]